jgi:hypothetical protein
MKLRDKRVLFDLLQVYFDEIDLTERDVLNKNPIAKLIKNNLKQAGYWKNRNRGK